MVKIVAVRGAPASYLAQLAPGYLAGRGYTEHFADDWNSYADTAALLAAVSFGSSSGSNLPRTAYLTKLASADPLLPGRVLRHTLPFNNDFSAASGSLGRQVNKTISGLPGGVQTYWAELWMRKGGTLHPIYPQAADYSHDGDAPAGSSDSRKIFFFETNQGGNRIGLQHSNASGAIIIDFGWGAVGGFATGDEATLTTPGLGGTQGWSSDAVTFDGKHLYRYIYNVIRTADVIVFRRFRQQMTGADGVTFDPQVPVCAGARVVRLTGTLATITSCKLLNDNLNNTVKQKALSTTSWDTTDVFASTNQDADDGLVARAENTKPWQGAQEYIGPARLVSAGDGRPLHDFRGNNFDDYYRGDANFPGGV